MKRVFGPSQVEQEERKESQFKRNLPEDDLQDADSSESDKEDLSEMEELFDNMGYTVDGYSHRDIILVNLNPLILGLPPGQQIVSNPLYTDYWGDD